MGGPKPFMERRGSCSVGYGLGKEGPTVSSNFTMVEEMVDIFGLPVAEAAKRRGGNGHIYSNLYDKTI